MNEEFFSRQAGTGLSPQHANDRPAGDLPPQHANDRPAGDLAKAAAKELYYLTCEMHAELWRLERMAQAYSRFDILQLKTGVLSAQADAILSRVKPYIAAEFALPAVLEGELDRAACDLAMELLRVEELRQSDLRVSDFNVEPRLFTRMDEVRARMDELLERALTQAAGAAGDPNALTPEAGAEARLPSVLYSCPLWVIKTAGGRRFAGERG